MNFKYLFTTKLYLCLTLILILSGCGRISKFTMDLMPFHGEHQTADMDTEPEQPDPQLVAAEPQMCLDEELIALQETGLWNDKSSPVSRETIKDAVYDFPLMENKQVDMYLHLFQHEQRKQFGRWLAKSTRYRPMIERELAEANLPRDLVYLAMIESGFNQLACSHSKAVGLWQFMKGTARQYHLRIDRYVDERRDAEKSTKAAVAYLADLYREFGDWHLAVAAYNAGPGKVRNGLKRHKVTNFWDLANRKYLRLETKRYVPKLIAALLIAKNPQKYGFTNIQYKKPLKYDTLKLGPGMSLKAVAMICNCSTKKIVNLNLELRKKITPSNIVGYRVKIPEHTALLAKKNLSRLHSIVTTGYKTHVLRKGDTLSKICARYKINKTTLLKVNNLHSSKLPIGRNLRIPYSTVSYQLLPKGSASAMAAYKNSLILHRIKKGDTISKIARLYRVPPKMIVAWNGLKNAHSIRAGHQLALYINRKGTVQHRNKTPRIKIHNIHRPRKTGQLLVLKATKKKIRLATSDEPFQWYNVKDGDSLWTISRKFRASTADIKRWNNLKSNLIHPGNKLKLKKV